MVDIRNISFIISIILAVTAGIAFYIAYSNTPSLDINFIGNDVNGTYSTLELKNSGG